MTQQLCQQYTAECEALSREVPGISRKTHLIGSLVRVALHACLALWGCLLVDSGLPAFRHLRHIQGQAH